LLTEEKDKKKLQQKIKEKFSDEEKPKDTFTVRYAWCKRGVIDLL